MISKIHFGKLADRYRVWQHLFLFYQIEAKTAMANSHKTTFLSFTFSSFMALVIMIKTTI